MSLANIGQDREQKNSSHENMEKQAPVLSVSFFNLGVVPYINVLQFDKRHDDQVLELLDENQNVDWILEQRPLLVNKTENDGLENQVDEHFQARNDCIRN